MSTRVRELLREYDFLTNAGTETYLVFQQGFALPEFCAFAVFDDQDAWAALERNYLHPILQAAADNSRGLILDAHVWRAQPDFIVRLGYTPDDLESINVKAVTRMRESVDGWRRRTGHSEQSFPVLIAADIGPRGDGYKFEDTEVTSARARAYHEPQLRGLAAAQVDLVCALTMTNPEESIGIVEAAVGCELPIIVSPTVETDGRLPDGGELGAFIRRVDAATEAAPLFYMVNCAHPSHLRPTLDRARSAGAPWLDRFRGFRANASTKSHEELDNSTELDRGDVQALARELAEMRAEYGLKIVGGCCGTDAQHIAAIAAA